MTAVVPEGGAAGYITVFPTGEVAPIASNLNVVGGETVANLVQVGVGSSGAVSLLASTRTDVVIDLEGYVVAQAGVGLYDPLASPVRVCDARASNPSDLSGPATQCNGRHLSAGGSLPVTVAGSFGVPVGATAVIANVTVVNPTSPGYVTVFADGSVRPTASNVNYAATQIIPNQAVIPVGADGKIDIYSESATDVVVDIAGYYSTTQGSSYVSASAPTRICDTRPGDPRAWPGW